MEKKFRAYIVPNFIREEKEETLVLKTKTGARIAFTNSSSLIGYEIENNRGLNNFLKTMFRIPKYKTEESFYNKINELVKQTNLNESKIEKFCKRNGLIPIKLLMKR